MIRLGVLLHALSYFKERRYINIYYYYYYFLSIFQMLFIRDLSQILNHSIQNFNKHLNIYLHWVLHMHSNICHNVTTSHVHYMGVYIHSSLTSRSTQWHSEVNMTSQHLPLCDFISVNVRGQ